MVKKIIAYNTTLFKSSPLIHLWSNEINTGLRDKRGHIIKVWENCYYVLCLKSYAKRPCFLKYSKTPIHCAPVYCKPRFTADILISLTPNRVEHTQTKPRFTAYPDLRQLFPFPKLCSNSGFYYIDVAAVVFVI